MTHNNQSPIRFLFLKLPPPPCAVLLVFKPYHVHEWTDRRDWRERVTSPTKTLCPGQGWRRCFSLASTGRAVCWNVYLETAGGSAANWTKNGGSSNKTETKRNGSKELLAIHKLWCAWLHLHLPYACWKATSKTSPQETEHRRKLKTVE